MFNYLFHFLTGYVIIKIEGTGAERFINTCTADKICIKRLKKHGKEYATGEIHPSLYHRVKLYARDYGCRISVMKRGGLPFMLLGLKKRKTFCIGFFAAVFILLWLCSRIWVIDILETDPVKRRNIEEILTKNGIVCGMPASRLEPFDLQQDVLASHSEYTWFWAELKGTHLSVDVRYAKKPPEGKPADKVCNIVASKSGIIRRMVVRSGEPAAEEGHAVKEGQLLVSGVVPNPTTSALYVYSDADVLAETSRTLSLDAPLTETERIKTGNVTKKYSVALFGKDFNLFFKAPAYTHYDGVIHQKKLKLFGEFYLPATLHIYEYNEVKPVSKSIAPEQLFEKLKKALMEELEVSVGKENIITSEFKTEACEDFVTVTLNAKCLEDICRRVDIEFDSRPFQPADISREVILGKEKTQEKPEE